MGRWQGARLLRKYFAYFAVTIGATLLASGAFSLHFFHEQNRASLFALHQQLADDVVLRVEQFMTALEMQLQWIRVPKHDPDLQQLRVEYFRFLRQSKDVTGLQRLNAAGIEELRISRLEPDVIGSGIDLSGDPAFKLASYRRHIL